MTPTFNLTVVLLAVSFACVLSFHVMPAGRICARTTLRQGTMSRRLASSDDNNNHDPTSPASGDIISPGCNAPLPPMHRRSVLAVAGAAIGLGALAPNAGASFGPGGASATSPAPIQDYSLEKWLGSTKSSERAGALSIQGAKKVSILLEKQLAKLDSDWGNLDSLISELAR
mmetsp:Transcript_20414/g.27713  ORF Transcript_20414/g.27713 Transcript_20414/m.27713 type:complete len:172 (-) Transcript_20414:6-521(-)